MEWDLSFLEDINLILVVVSGIVGLGIIPRFKSLAIFLMSDMKDVLNRKIDKVYRSAEFDDKINDVIARCGDDNVKKKLEEHLESERVHRDAILALQLEREHWSNAAHKTLAFWLVVAGILGLYLGFLLAGPFAAISPAVGVLIMVASLGLSGITMLLMNVGLTGYPTYGKVRKKIEANRKGGVEDLRPQD